MKLTVGPDLSGLKAALEARVDDHFRPTRERRALYAPKVLDATRVLAGMPVPSLDAEAKASKVAVEELARSIIRQGDADAMAEAERVELKRRVRRALTVEKLEAILEPYGIGVYG